MWDFLVLFLSWLAEGAALGSLFLLHPAGWLLVGLGLACGVAALRHRYRPEPRWLLATWPVATSCAAIGLGLAFRYDGYGVTDPAPGGPSRALDMLVLGHLAGCVVAVLLARGFRLLLVPTLCLGTIAFIGCTFLAGMSVTGVWL